jgi:hypothetical protein
MNPCHHHIDFWLKNPMALVSEHYVIPRNSMTLNQKLNSIVRLALLLALTCHFLLGMSRTIFYVVILAMIGTVFIYYSPSTKMRIHNPAQLRNERVAEIIVATIGNNKALAEKPELTHTDVNLVSAELSMPPQVVKSAIIANTPDAVAASAPSVNDTVAQVAIDDNSALFDIPKNYEWGSSDKHPYDQRLFTGIDEAYTDETTNQRELLLSYGDMLDTEFEHVLTKDYYGKESQWWRDQGSFLVDRDVYHPKNNDLFFDPY